MNWALLHMPVRLPRLPAPFRVLLVTAGLVVSSHFASAQTVADPLVLWPLESSLSAGSVHPGLYPSSISEVLLASASWTSDRYDGSWSREFTADDLSADSDPATGTRVEFTVTAAPGASATVESLSWWAKARSTADSTHNSARCQLYWSIDGFNAPISEVLNPITGTQAADNSWVGNWTQGTSNFSPTTLSGGDSITFRLVIWDGSDWNVKRLLIDEIRIEGIGTAGSGDQFDTLRGKRFDQLTGGSTLDPVDPLVAAKLQVIANSATTWQASLNRAPARSNLWADAASTTISAEFNNCYNRIRAMALAWATPNCPLQGDTSLRDDILGAIDWMHANRYYAGKAEYDNWWHWEIGGPQRLGDILVLMYDELGSARLAENLATLDHFVPYSRGWMTGANRSDKCLAASVHGILAKSAGRIARARDELTPVFPYVSSGDGFYTDGSFIQHTAIAYTGSYGAELIKGVSLLYELLQDSTWQLTAPSHLNLIDWIEDGYAPLYHRGAMADHVRGRAISRNGSTDHSTGHYIMRSILRIADAAPPEIGGPILSWVKGQALSDDSRDFADDAPLSELAATRGLVNDPSIIPSAPTPAHHRFPSMDRVVHRRPSHNFGLSMSSSRVYTYESLNSENLRGWFTGDGMLTFHNHDLTQFEQDFWPTVDPYHLPGVTNPVATRANASGERKFTGQNRVGGVGLGEFGSASMQLATWGSTLRAKKSWFFLDDEVVCLGADITCSDGASVHTTIENRRLSSTADEALMIDGASMPATLGWTDTRPGPQWLALENTGGIWFPEPVTLHLKREARTGSYYDINRGYATSPITRIYLTAWIDHGSAPTSGTYAYVLLPDADASATASYSSTPDVEILANDAGLQAVRDTTLGLTAAHFWAASGGSTDGITCNGPAAVVFRRDGSLFEIAISDPSWQRSTPLIVTLDEAVGIPVTLDPAVTVLATHPSLQLSVNPSGTRGRSLRASFSDLAPGDDFASIEPDTTLLLDVLANDSSLGGGALTIEAVGTPTHGQASRNGGAILYQPHPGFTGIDSFTYTAGDGNSTAEATVTVEATTSPADASPLSVSASTDDGNVPANTLDGDLATRWSALGDGQWILYDLGAPRVVEALSIAFHLGDQRTSTFDLDVSNDGAIWSNVHAGVVSSGVTLGLERFDFPAPVFARFIRITGHGNSASLWNSFTEVAIHGGRNQAPIAVPFAASTPETIPISVASLAQATDPDGQPAPLHLLHPGSPSNGTAEIASDGVVYTPEPGFVGSDSFSCQLSDGHKVSEIAVSVTIERPTTLAGYLNTHFTPAEQADSLIGDPTADPDLDGIVTAIEFLTGGNPRSFDPHPLRMIGFEETTGRVSLTILIRTNPDGGRAEFSGAPSPSASIGGVICTVEGSTILGDWPNTSLTEITPSDSLPTPPEGLAWHAFQFDSLPHAFARLRAEFPTPSQ